jgi:guanidinopropionase
MVHFDAHTDTLDICFGGYKYTHGTGFRHAIKEGVLDPKRTIQIGIRSPPYHGPTYVSFEVDARDPVYAPGTGTPEIGGLTTLEAQRLLRSLQGLDLVGGDVVEVSPPFDASGKTALVAATLAFGILCLRADSGQGRKSAD